jgi:heme/copper-type cytochrome/quinol oxidase subunit 2
MKEHVALKQINHMTQERNNTMVETKKTQTERCTTESTSPAGLGRKYRLIPLISLFLLVAMIVPVLYTLAQAPRVIQITADKDNKFKVSGQKQPVITVKAKEVIKFRIMSHEGDETDPKYPGCGHTFSVKELKDQGWDVCLKNGMNEFVLVAPSKPGEYKIECLAKCGKGHDDMAMKMTVTG